MDDETKKNFVGANKQAKISVDDLIESGTVVCGTPKQAIEQIKNCHKILGHGLTNISMKVGNIEDIVINKQIEIFGNKVLPYVKYL